jgi:hypothetical protein
MKARRKGTSESGTHSRGSSKKVSSGSSRRSKKNNAADTESYPQSNSRVRDLPPNENIRKRADEVYGDTEIPERKPGT